MASVAASYAFLSSNSYISVLKVPHEIRQTPSFVSVKQHKWLSQRLSILASRNTSAIECSPGLYSAQTFELTANNVDLVLEDVRPYLISDGGNVDVVAVEDGVIFLKLQGRFASPSSSS